VRLDALMKVKSTKGDMRSVHGNKTATLMPDLPLWSAVGNMSSVGN
jgi:hypothetical protein